MNQYLDLLRNNILFNNIELKNIIPLLECLEYYTKQYQKDEVILRAGEKVTSVGIMLTGTAHIIKEDMMGNVNIISTIVLGDIFGESFACTENKACPVSLYSVSKCTILWIPFKNIVKQGNSTCGFHATLLENMLYIVAQKNIMLNFKISILSQRTTKDKLLLYFNDEATKAEGLQFEISFSRSQLADFLCVDRSAMTRELCKLQKDGIIKINKNKFELSQQWYHLNKTT